MSSTRRLAAIPAEGSKSGVGQRYRLSRYRWSAAQFTKGFNIAR